MQHLILPYAKNVSFIQQRIYLLEDIFLSKILLFCSTHVCELIQLHTKLQRKALKAFKTGQNYISLVVCVPEYFVRIILRINAVLLKRPKTQNGKKVNNIF